MHPYILLLHILYERVSHRQGKHQHQQRLMLSRPVLTWAVMTSDEAGIMLQVHKIAQLDIRMANTDRNGGNILACHGADGRWELVPVRPLSPSASACTPETFVADSNVCPP